MRDGRLVEHQQQFPTLGTSLTCVGSHSKALDDAPDERSLPGADDAELTPGPSVSHPQATISR